MSPNSAISTPEVARNLNDELFKGKPIGDFGLDADAEAAIVAFLMTLTDRTPYRQPIINRK